MSSTTLLFPPFRLDLINEELWRAGDRIPLRPKEFAVLAYLAGNSQRLVRKQELLEHVWPGVSVGDELLRGYIRGLRLALGDAAADPRVIETVSRRGYRFLPPVTTDAPAAARPLDSADRAIVVGRDAELRALEDAFARVKQGERRTVLIAGEPGTGKTMVLRTFLDRARADAAAAVCDAACAQGYDAGERFVPLVHALGSLCRQPGRDRLVGHLERCAPGWLVQLPDLLGDAEYARVEERGRGATTEQLRREYAAALEAVARDVPIVIAIEDLQWSDHESADLFAALAREGPPGLLLVATYRRVDAITSAHPIRAAALELVTSGLAVELPMTNFSRQHVAEYLQARFPNPSFPPALSRALHETTDGNPAMLVKIVERLVERSDVRPIDGRWRFQPHEGHASPDAADRIAALVQSRVRELGPVLRSRAPLRVGVLHSLTGMMAWSEMPVVDATLLAIEEINQQGGIRGHRVDPVVVDGESDEEVFAQRAEQLMRDERVCTVFGCWISASRKMVVPVVERHDSLLVYPVQHEGMECSPHVLYTGAVPNQQISPAVRWAYGFQGKRRFFLIGWDSIYSHAVHEIVRDELAALGGRVVGEDYLRPESTDVGRIVRAIADAQPDVILNSLVGDINILYSRALHAGGRRSERVPTVYFSVSEIELLSLSAGERAGDFAAWSYFQSLDRAQNQTFVNRFRARYGRQRVTADPMEAAYVGVHLWRQAVEAAESDSPREIRAALAGQTLDAPEGLVRVDPATQHLWKAFRLGRIGPNGQIDVVWTSGSAIQPEPFPATRSREAWTKFLAERYEQWNGRWTRPVAAV